MEIPNEEGERRVKIKNYFVMPHPPLAVPAVGRGEEREIQDTLDACQEVAETIAKLKPDTIVLITPHGPMFSDAVAISRGQRIRGDFADFRAPDFQMDLAIDLEITDAITHAADQEGIPLALIDEQNAQVYGVKYGLDHGAMVPLYFVNQAYRDYELVHVTYGFLSQEDLYNFGRIIQEAATESDKKVVMIASADLSHRLKDKGAYDYSPYGEKFDIDLLTKLEQGDVMGIFDMDEVMIEEAGQCGLRSIYIMLGAIDQDAYQGTILSYEGPFGVGYAVVRLTTNPYVILARESLTHYLETGEYLNLDQEDLPVNLGRESLPAELLNMKRAAFVTLYKNGGLRGCIGTISPYEDNLAQEIITNAVSAGTRDNRFPRVDLTELVEIEFSVDVLGEPEPATREELDPKLYGVIVTAGHRRGLLLPDLEGVDTVDYQLAIALQKAGIDASEDYEIERFQVIRQV